MTILVQKNSATGSFTKHQMVISVSELGNKLKNGETYTGTAIESMEAVLKTATDLVVYTDGNEIKVFVPHSKTWFETVEAYENSVKVASNFYHQAVSGGLPYHTTETEVRNFLDCAVQIPDFDAVKVAVITKKEGLKEVELNGFTPSNENKAGWAVGKIVKDEYDKGMFHKVLVISFIEE